MPASVGQHRARQHRQGQACRGQLVKPFAAPAAQAAAKAALHAAGPGGLAAGQRQAAPQAGALYSSIRGVAGWCHKACMTLRHAGWQAALAESLHHAYRQTRAPRACSCHPPGTTVAPALPPAPESSSAPAAPAAAAVRAAAGVRGRLLATARRLLSAWSLPPQPPQTALAPTGRRGACRPARCPPERTSRWEEGSRGGARPASTPQTTWRLERQGPPLTHGALELERGRRWQLQRPVGGWSVPQYGLQQCVGCAAAGRRLAWQWGPALGGPSPGEMGKRDERDSCNPPDCTCDCPAMALVASLCSSGGCPSTPKAAA